MTPLEIVALVALIVVATLASYIQRVYSEFGKILSREVQENLDAWEVRIEPHLGLSREHAALCASVLKQLSLGVDCSRIRGAALHPADASRTAERF